jgi:hypothetical protein
MDACWASKEFVRHRRAQLLQCLHAFQHIGAYGTNFAVGAGFRRSDLALATNPPESFGNGSEQAVPIFDRNVSTEAAWRGGAGNCITDVTTTNPPALPAAGCLTGLCGH